MWCKLTTNVDLTIKNEYQIQLQFDTHLGLHFHFLYSKTELLSLSQAAFLYVMLVTAYKKTIIYAKIRLTGIALEPSGVSDGYLMNHHVCLHYY